jgi:hypothetical protein
MKNSALPKTRVVLHWLPSHPTLLYSHRNKAAVVHSSSTDVSDEEMYAEGMYPAKWMDASWAIQR